MSDNYSTLWVQRNINAAATNRALQAIQQTGRALPCSVIAVNGAIVTVSFEVVGPWTLPPLTLPKAESPWARTPTQIGDVGLTVPADTALGGISGLGSGPADLTINYGNLSTLVWVPVGATTLGAMPRANIFWGNGPHGARIGDTANAAYVDCNPDTGTVTIVAGGKTWTFAAAGLTMSTGIVLETHLHSGVSSGSVDTGPPTP